MKLPNQYSLWTAVVLMAMAGYARGEDQIQTYTVPKEVPPAAAAVPGNSPELPVNSSPFHWTTPAGWQEMPATSIRLASFSIPGQEGGKAEVAVTSFPGDMGTELENVNCWRRELKLPPTQQDQITSQPVTVDAQNGKVYDIVGTSERIIVAMVPRDGATWFFKMHGDNATVSAAQPAFMQFLQSVRFAAPVPSDTAATSAIPHADVPITADTGAGSSQTPTWNVPPHWTEKEPGPMIFKSYSATDNGATAMVTVSFFPGTVGGVLANVNRWRGQLGLAPVEDDQLGSVIQTLNGTDGPATLVDFSGTSKAGESARLVAAIVPHGENTWFYKLIGDPAAVSQEKEAFVNFVKTVHYP